MPISAGLLGGSQDVWVLGGRVADERARSVTFSTPDGGPIVRPLGAGGFYVAPVPWSGHCPAKNWNPLFVALGTDGQRLGEARICSCRTNSTRKDMRCTPAEAR